MYSTYMYIAINICWVLVIYSVLYMCTLTNGSVVHTLYYVCVQLRFNNNLNRNNEASNICTSYTYCMGDDQ